MMQNFNDELQKITNIVHAILWESLTYNRFPPSWFHFTTLFFNILIQEYGLASNFLHFAVSDTVTL